MIISPLSKVTIISPNKSKRTHRIDTITIHCMACNGSIAGIGRAFANPKKKASSNYGIDSNGLIGCYVPEEYRSWCSSSTSNDDRAITVEVANDGGAPDWHVSPAAISALCDLLTDVCRRNNIKALKWRADKSLIGQVELQNMTVHRWFKNKACPGDYLYNLHGSIAAVVNQRLGVDTVIPIPAPDPKVPGGVAVPTIRKGSRGANAKLLQQDLNYFGCGLVEDGIIGKASVAALKAWQKKYGLVADGIYGQKSYAKMRSLVV